jgi:hypothetical protein
MTKWFTLGQGFELQNNIFKKPLNSENVKAEFARVLGPGQIVTSLEHLGTVPGVQVTYR